MEIKSVELPGIGMKYSVQTADGLLVIIIHHTGQREIYLMGDPDEDEPRWMVEMNDETARRVGAILMGADYQPMVDDRVEIMRKNIMVEWIKLAPSSTLANQDIKDTRIRTKTGATIIGIQRGDLIIGSPDIKEVLLGGDVLMAIGKKDQIKALEVLCKGEG